MDLSVSRRDLIIAGVFLVVVGSVVGWSRFDVARKHAALEARASTHVDAFYEGMDRAQFEHVVDVQSDKAFAFFGEDWGVVRLYTRQRGDAAMESFLGLEHFYEYGPDGWQLTDSPQIRDPEHIVAGYQAFEDAGHEVDNEAFLRFSR